MFSHGKLITALQYFTDKVNDYWHILYPLTDPKKMKGDPYLYFYDISRKALDYKGQFSDEGIYLFLGYDGKYHLHALELAQYALASWLAWRKTDEERWLKKAILHCDWLIEHQEDDGAWRIKHINPKYGDLPSPWASGMAQGLAVSALLRAFRYTGEEVYLDAAQNAIVFLEKSVQENGVKRTLDEGFIYEEYPRKKLSGVLNGYITALFGIVELASIKKEYECLFMKNRDNLLKILPLYDVGYWSLYSLDNNLASGFYHRLVTRQLFVMGRWDVRFLEYAEKFEGYLHCKRCVMVALKNKIFGKNL